MISDAAFVLSRPHRTVVAQGTGRVFRSSQEAVTALRNREVGHIVGALPFTPGAPAALWAPDSVRITAGGYHPAAAPALPDVEIESALPSPDEHMQRVAAAVRLLSDPVDPLRKVVLARALRLAVQRPVRAAELLDRLVSTDPAHNGFLVDLSAAGAAYQGRALVGSSPEILVRRDGGDVLSHPLAGSARRAPGDEEDRAAAHNLLASTKDQHEHRYVVDHVDEVLREYCRAVHAPDTPELTNTPEMWHLGTPITATVPDSGPSALELAVALHPTPAICGTPTSAAARVIEELEGDRGFYAGAVGWCDADGDGEWMVSIRCAELAADGRTLTAHAGGGIVAGSDPVAELAETIGKFQRILGPLGAADLPVTVA
ncbi:hypothetical protein B0T36_25455 [Nocardia donostiensis]|uniref:isochorismate synthase n=1 Tax=Nocardia donostiensis TaxID=1538463 RepID=UPI0009D9EE96|nr:isochorismate synthase [Nocardia donostiensis]OQS12357.1 hypothetical protein B0T36_25455 [Nocardia donostiensis]